MPSDKAIKQDETSEIWIQVEPQYVEHTLKLNFRQKQSGIKPK